MMRHDRGRESRRRERTAKPREASDVGHWGVRSYDCDEAADALDAAFEQVHGARYEELMDDRNPMSFDQIQASLASEQTLVAALAAHASEAGADPAAWDEEEHLGFAGIVVRHAESGVPIPEGVRKQALGWLRGEDLDWDRAATKRWLRRMHEIERLERLAPRGAENP
jgi:hypothetical protein